MLSVIGIALFLYGPALLCVFSLYLLFRLDIARRTIFTVQPFGLFGISFPITNRTLSRLLLTIAALGFLLLYALYDYSLLFPQHLAMEVFFDQAGTARMVGDSLTSDEQRALGIPINYIAYRGRYFNKLDDELRNVLHAAHVFSLEGGIVHSSGETSFKVMKVDGWQRYHLYEAKGELTHTLEAAHRPAETFFTFFEMLPSADDYIQPSFRDLIISHRLLIRPQFKEFLAESRTSRSVAFNVAVVGITEVHAFPWPSFSSTIYCADLGELGLIPVAYAIYKAEK